MTISPQNIQWPTGTPYVVADRGTMALGVKEVVQLIPDTIVATENFEGAITGSGTWFVDTSNPHTGTKYLRSAIIGNSASTTYTFTVPATSTFLRLWYRISSELNFDFLKIYKNSISVPNVLFSTSGTANVWTQISLPLAGVTSVIFEYSKDSSSTGGLDLAGIDDLEWIIPGVPAVTNYEPLHLNNNNQLKVTMLGDTIAVTGIPHLACATDSVTICQGGALNVTVLNPTPTVSGTVNTRPLSCATDSIEICNDSGNPIPVSGTVSVNNFPAVAHLDCATDSITICPGAAPIIVTLNNTVGVTGHVSVDNFPAVAHLNCATDSVEICNDVGSPITISGTVELGATTLAALETINIGNVPHVIVDSLPEVEIKNDSGNPIPVSFSRLTCGTDSVEICNDAGSPITVTVMNPTLPVSGTISVVPGKRSLRGLYYGTSPIQTYTTAADAATGGDLWLVNTSNTVVCYLRSVRFTALLDSLAILTNLPTIRMERMTFTGTPSGAQITPAKRDSTDSANTGTLRTAATGMTITAGAAIETFTPPTADVIGGLLSVNATASIPVEQLFVADIDSFITLRQNEGIVLRQDTAGNATENRNYWVNFVWEEI